jgi:hypothetical protein
LQQDLLQTVWKGAVAVIESFLEGADSSTLTTGAAEMREMIPAATAQQLLQLATGVCTQLMSVDCVASCCANPGCTNCSKLSERELVAGKSTVCSSCRAVRLCSAECKTAYWKAGHRQVCKRLRGGKQQRKAGDKKAGSSGAGGAGGAAATIGSGSGRKSRTSSSSRSNEAVGAGYGKSSMRSSSAGGSQGSSNTASSS